MPDPTQKTLISRIWCPKCGSPTFKIRYTTIIEPTGVSEQAMHVSCKVIDWEGKCIRPTCGYTMKKEEAENGKSEGRS